MDRRNFVRLLGLAVPAAVAGGVMVLSTPTRRLIASKDFKAINDKTGRIKCYVRGDDVDPKELFDILGSPETPFQKLRLFDDLQRVTEIV